MNIHTHHHVVNLYICTFEKTKKSNLNCIYEHLYVHCIYIRKRKKKLKLGVQTFVVCTHVVYMFEKEKNNIKHVYKHSYILMSMHNL